MSIWSGQIDGDGPMYAKVFQKVCLKTEGIDIVPGNFVLHGFSVDEGVRRNNGRTGAKDAPDIIRKNLSDFPLVQPGFMLYDGGNIFCKDGSLEEAQELLAEAVKSIVQKGARSVVLGGGHELMFGHYQGIQRAFPQSTIGIINIDAHFDNREPEEGVGASSGTGFWQIAQQDEIHCLHIGIQKNSNTLRLFNFAEEAGMAYVLSDDIFFENLPGIYKKIDALAGEVDVLYVTICMDVFNAAIAPGVSAVACNGLFADAPFMHLYRYLLNNEKLLALDVAEVNPLYDRDGQTAKLAAALLNEWFMI